MIKKAGMLQIQSLLFHFATTVEVEVAEKFVFKKIESWCKGEKVGDF